jgi:hypothetical protein
MNLHGRPVGDYAHHLHFKFPKEDMLDVDRRVNELCVADARAALLTTPQQTHRCLTHGQYMRVFDAWATGDSISLRPQRFNSHLRTEA